MTALDFLKFKDWIASKEYEKKDWLIVGCWRKTNQGDFCTFSALIPNTSKDKDTVLADSEWEIDLFFGLPAITWEKDSKDVSLDLGEKEEINGVVFEPFCFNREFHGIHPSQIDLIQNFILYHNLYYIKEKDVLRRIDIDGSEQDVVQYKRDGEKQLIEVNVHFLRDYLAARHKILVRYHDHRRRINNSLKENLDEKPDEFNVKTEKSNYSVYITIKKMWEPTNFSLLIGKDIILPYNKPDYSHLGLIEQTKFCKFIIGINDNGEPIEETCNEKELSNWYEDRGKPLFLTPVYFKPEVLQKYYNEPRKFTVDGRVQCLDLWGIPFDINEDGLVYVWLGDLGRIPFKEQQYWKTFNVHPSGGITEERFKTDVLAQFVDPKDTIYQFKKTFELVEKISKEKLGFSLFMELKEGDTHIYKTLHIPVTEEEKEADEQILYLAKLITDSINEKELKKISGLKIDGESIKGSIDLLEHFLAEDIPTQELNDIIQPLRMVQKLRSSGVAHRKGKKFPKMLRRYNLDKLTNDKKVEKLIKKLTESLKLLIDYISAF